MVCTYKLDTWLRLSDSFYLCLSIKTVSKSLQKCSLCILFYLQFAVWFGLCIWFGVIHCCEALYRVVCLDYFISLVSVAFGLVLFRVRIRIGFSLMLKPNLLSLFVRAVWPILYIWLCVCVCFLGLWIN